MNNISNIKKSESSKAKSRLNLGAKNHIEAGRFQTRSKGISSYLQTRADVEVIPSKIIRITPTMIVFECITDVKNQCFETREFPMILFEKYSYLKVGLVCNLNITLSPNNFNLRITNLNNAKIENLFDTSSLFEGLEDLNVHYK